MNNKIYIAGTDCMFQIAEELDRKHQITTFTSGLLTWVDVHDEVLKAKKNL